MNRLLERDQELAMLTQALASASAGTGTVVIVEGRAGIGKSRLLAAACDQAGASGIGVLLACGIELERDAPFGVAFELFAAALAAVPVQRREQLLAGQAGLARFLLDPTVPVVGDPQALIRGLYWLTAGLAAQQPLVVALDDAQWADRPSLAFLAHLAARLDGLPVMLLLGLRTDEPGAADDLFAALRGVPGGLVLGPQPLSEAGVRSLVAAELPDPDPAFVVACARVTGGNPFLTRELARALREDAIRPTAESVARVAQLVPASVLHSVLARLGRLGPHANSVAAAVAVLGDGTSLRHAAGLAELDARAAEAAADALARAGILADGEPLRFGHPLIATAVHTDLPAFGRARAHREAASLLAGDQATVREVAAHLLLSRPDADPWVAGTLREAARSALVQGDSRAAARLLDRALAEPPAPPDRAGVLVELAEAQTVHGDLAAEGHAAEALELADEPGTRVRALQALSRLRLALREHPAAAQALAEVLAELDSRTPDGERALAEYLTATRFTTALRPEAERGLAPIVRATRRGTAPGDPGLLSHVVLELAFAGEPAAVIRTLAEQATAADPLVDPATYGMPMGMLVQALCTVDELATAERFADAALAAAGRRASFFAAATASYHRAIARYHRGALADALADLDQAQAPSREGWPAGGAWAYALEAHIHLERGDTVAARVALAPAPVVAESMDEGILRFAQARLALAEHEPTAALAAAQDAGRLLGEGFGIDHPGFVPWRWTAALAALASGDRDLADELADAGLARARALGVARGIALALRTSAALAGDEQRVELLTEAVGVLADSPSQLQRAHALTELGAALRRSGRREEALAPLREALQVADRMGAQPLAETAREELRASGARPRRAAYTGVEALTPAELRVARLAAHGLTNREIAEQLFVTGKTVQTHLAHAYRKLDISSRRELGTTLEPI